MSRPVPQPPPQDTVKAGKPVAFRRRFLMLDPRAIDKNLLYPDGDRYLIGLVLETERVGKEPRFIVKQAVPAHVRKNGNQGKVVGSWHFLSAKWDAKREEGAK